MVSLDVLASHEYRIQKARSPVLLAFIFSMKMLILEFTLQTCNKSLVQAANLVQEVQVSIGYAS